jgi:alkanesulfonate monooxygenase SsuD/methylene tetrahydromethanopterin reductase-like flavin-dependent oxidoreductase (luciferase family)
MQVVLFHLMPYAEVDIAAARAHGTVWGLPNKHYDPRVAHRLYNRFLDELEYGEELGFDAVSVNEHHQTAYGLMPSPIVTASALARRTSRVKIAILGSALPLRSHPMMVAEEHAMIDVITGGRLISGFVRGIGAEYHTFGVNPTFSHDRFHEAHDLIVRAWTEKGPFAFEGRHYRVSYVNLWPQPLQKPHPPIYYGATSPDSPVMVARRGWNLALSRQPLANCARAIKSYREERSKHPGLPGSGNAIMVRDIYVADTDEQALREAIPQITRFWQLATDNVWRGDSISTDALPKFTERFPYFPGGLNVARLDEWGTSLIGSPDTVIKKARVMIETARPDSLVGMFSFGGLKHEQVMHSIELFATKVMPALGA